MARRSTPGGPKRRHSATASAFRCLDVRDGDSADGTAVQVSSCQWQVTAGRNQQFEFLASADDHYKIRVRPSGLVLQVAGNGSGADVTQQADTDAVGQQWRIVDHGSGVISLVNRQGGLALDVWQASTADGARISPWTATRSTNQRFQLHRV
ncbi:RICIN domain-containing protein [Streptomyces scabiei]|uniref:RICIN domain-containing protein n=1 Tax=Streptomyces scabiei TaxID=1930 RepID=UPI0038F689D5